MRVGRRSIAVVAGILTCAGGVRVVTAQERLVWADEFEGRVGSGCGELGV